MQAVMHWNVKLIANFSCFANLCTIYIYTLKYSYDKSYWFSTIFLLDYSKEGREE